MSKRISPELLSGFASEATELLVRIAANVEQVHMQPGHVGRLDEARRAAHQAKGAASMVGLAELAHVFYFMEEALEDLRGGQTPWTADTAGVFEACVLQLGEYFKGLARGEVAEQILTPDVAAELGTLRGNGAFAASVGVRVSPPSAASASRPKPETGAAISIPAELLEVFRMEAEEHLSRIAESLNELANQPGHREHLQEVRRSVHTLKGASGSVGFGEMSRLSHRMEDLLDRLSEGGEPLEPGHHSLLLATFDALCDLTAGSQDPSILRDRVRDLYDRYDKLDRSHAGAAAATDTPRPAPRDTTPGLSAELIESFRQETEERLQSVQEQLRMLEANPADAGLTLAIRRTIHTVKGASAMIGHVPMSRLAHRMEDLLEALAERAVAYGDESRNLLYLAADALVDLTATVGRPSQSGAALDEIVKRLDALLGGVTGPRRESSQPLAPLGAEPSIDLTAAAADPAGPVNAPSASGQYVRVPIERLDELVRFVSELLVNRSTFEQYLGSYGQEVRELNLSIARLKRISHRLDTDIEVTALRGGLGQLAVRGVMMTGKADKRGEFDLLEFDRYTDLHLVSRDLSETAVDVTAAAGELRARAGDFDSYLSRLSRLTSDIQDRLMRLRMVPLAALSTRLHRSVRVTAERTGKPVDFRIEGDRIELDKTVLEEMAGPLEHALRNAVDHGIESETLRRATGKPARGRLVLEARYEGTHVVLSISDDGAGINPELIRSAAVDRGLLSEAEAAQLSDDRVLDTIFQPGFSTARQVSEVSGRGVGMDVIKSTVTRLKGTVELTSSPGTGARLMIRLPMTLAIMRVLLVRTRQETYALPANVVTRILRVGAESIEEVGGKTILRHEGKVCPLVRLGDALRLSGTTELPLARRPALMVQIGDQTVALVVDEVVDAREVVVKTLGTLLRKVRGFTGATLMGDGSVVLIVNPADLVEGRSAKTSQLAPAVRQPAVNRSLEILTVDDSVSVRRVLAKLVENAGWRPTPAKDGLEALELLQRGLRPDAILLDVEMPRMDGYELLGALRGIPHLKEVPVVMLTSRAGEKHRKKAFELGATDYLVKPYQDETLLAVVRRVVRESKETAVR